MAHLTNKFIEHLVTPDKRKEYFDDTIKGLSLRITPTGKKTFSVVKRIDGKLTRLTIGPYPIVTIKQARDKAIKLLNVINDGVNPNLKDKDESLRKIALKDVFQNYIISRGTNLKSNTRRNYEGILDSYLRDWQRKPIAHITRDMIEKRHRKITAQSPSRANSVMRLLRALFNYAMGEYEDSHAQPIITHNPVARLTHVKAWNREERRKNVMKPHEIKIWWQALETLPDNELNQKRPNHSETARDYFKFVLLTGLRRREASNLTWENIDFSDRSLLIPNTKNYESHSLPLSDFVIDLLKVRKSNTKSQYVFEGLTINKPMNDPKKQVAKLREISGVDFTIHDLRRTFITIAESLDIPSYTLKRLMNHKSDRDVTGGYIIQDINRLRAPMQAINQYILDLVND